MEMILLFQEFMFRHNETSVVWKSNVINKYVEGTLDWFVATFFLGCLKDIDEIIR